jgi:hypothetical protein
MWRGFLKCCLRHLPFSAPLLRSFNRVRFSSSDISATSWNNWCVIVGSCRGIFKESITKHLKWKLIITRRITSRGWRYDHETKEGLSSQGKSAFRVSEFSSKNLLKISIYCVPTLPRETYDFPSYKNAWSRHTQMRGKAEVPTFVDCFRFASVAIQFVVESDLVVLRARE